jgi:chemotaxis protein methyltransferase CheR
MMTGQRSGSAHPTPIARTPNGWSEPAFERVAEVVYVVAGLVFPANRQASAESGMRRAMTALRLSDAGALARAVQVPGEARDVVLAELTVGETYFFREAQQLDLLRTDVLPMMAPRCGPNRPLRIWSAGCASGEEPYTVAIMLRELGWAHPVQIMGTDVARPRLDAAKRGRFTRWSLRGVSTVRVDRWFERRGPHFQLDSTIVDSVNFRPLNLVSDEYPTLASGTQEQDVVLCRNVLIYFDMPAVERIATRLLASLAPDGWLLLGASDPPLHGLVPCEVVVTPAGVAYRRADRDPERAQRLMTFPPPAVAWSEPTSVTWSAIGRVPPLPDLVDEPPPVRVAAPPARATPIAEATPPASESAAAAFAAADYPRAEALASRAVDRDETDLSSWIVLVRTVANQGRLREADERCTRALDLHRLSPELHYLHATLLSAAGQYREAINAARRALYLDRQYAMAYLQLGDALAHEGDIERASRAFENVGAALAGIDDDVAVAGADGVPASRLRQVAARWLRALGEERVP